MLQIWDKQEPINGVNAAIILTERADLRNEDEVILVVNDEGVVTNIELPSTLRANYELDSSMSTLEVGQYHLDQLNKIKEESVQAEQTIEDLRAEVAELKMMMAKQFNN